MPRPFFRRRSVVSASTSTATFFSLWRLTRSLKREPFEIGFNPWSHGLESEYFVSFASRFLPYGAFAGFPRTHNLYDRARSYLGLAAKPAALTGKIPAQAKRILISPFSTDVRKSLNHDDLRKLIAWLGARYSEASMALALFPEEDGKVRGSPDCAFPLRQESQTLARVSRTGERQRSVRGCGCGTTASG